MDPNEVHRRMTELAARIIATLDKSPAVERSHDAVLKLLYEANDLAEAVEALDGWLRKGGFLPKAWEDETLSRRFP